MHERKRAIASGFPALQRRWQRLEVVDLPFGQFRHHIKAAEALKFAREIIRQVRQEMLGLAARLVGRGARVLRLVLRAVGALVADIRQDRGADRAYGKHRAHDGDLSCAYQ